MILYNHCFEFVDVVLFDIYRGMDTNFDGKLEYKEFVENAYDMYKEFAKFETEDESVATAQLLFAELDKDKDRFLVADELRPILHYLQPGELSYAKYYSTFLYHEVSLSQPKMLITLSLNDYF